MASQDAIPGCLMWIRGVRCGGHGPYLGLRQGGTVPSDGIPRARAGAPSGCHTPVPELGPGGELARSVGSMPICSFIPQGHGCPLRVECISNSCAGISFLAEIRSVHPSCIRHCTLCRRKPLPPHATGSARRCGCPNPAISAGSGTGTEWFHPAIRLPKPDQRNGPVSRFRVFFLSRRVRQILQLRQHWRCNISSGSTRGRPWPLSTTSQEGDGPDTRPRPEHDRNCAASGSETPGGSK
jgi:hypothetical protein